MRNIPKSACTSCLQAEIRKRFRQYRFEFHHMDRYRKSQFWKIYYYRRQLTPIRFPPWRLQLHRLHCCSHMQPKVWMQQIKVRSYHSTHPRHIFSCAPSELVRMQPLQKRGCRVGTEPHLVAVVALYLGLVIFTFAFARCNLKQVLDDASHRLIVQCM